MSPYRFGFPLDRVEVKVSIEEHSSVGSLVKGILPVSCSYDIAY
jgi:hypothetical protein